MAEKDFPSKSEVFGTFDTLSDRLDNLDGHVVDALASGGLAGSALLPVVDGVVDLRSAYEAGLVGVGIGPITEPIELVLPPVDPATARLLSLSIFVAGHLDFEDLVTVSSSGGAGSITSPPLNNVSGAPAQGFGAYTLEMMVAPDFGGGWYWSLFGTVTPNNLRGGLALSVEEVDGAIDLDAVFAVDHKEYGSYLLRLGSSSGGDPVTVTLPAQNQDPEPHGFLAVEVSCNTGTFGNTAEVVWAGGPGTTVDSSRWNPDPTADSCMVLCVIGIGGSWVVVPLTNTIPLSPAVPKGAFQYQRDGNGTVDLTDFLTSGYTTAVMQAPDKIILPAYADLDEAFEFTIQASTLSADPMDFNPDLVAWQVGNFSLGESVFVVNGMTPIPDANPTGYIYVWTARPVISQLAGPAWLVTPLVPGP